MKPDDGRDAPLPEIPGYLRESLAVAVVRVSLDGTVLDANLGFWRVVGRTDSDTIQSPWNSARMFIQPTFQHLTGLPRSAGDPLIFRGIINLGEPGTTPSSLKGSAYRSGGEILVVAEHDPAEADRMRQSVLALNRELAETQRQLVRDIRARRRAENELAETNRGILALYAELEDKAQALQRASELKSRFLSNMTHEFRTPINAILSLSRILLEAEDGDLTTDQRTEVTFIRQCAESLSEFVNDLLDLAKIEAGKTTMRRERFEVAELFAALRGMFRPILGSAPVALVFEEAPGIPVMDTDQGKLAQVLRNFIANALKFTEQGEIRVSAAMADASTIVFSVTDTGIGIASEDLDRIFQEFAQVEGPRQRKFRGTGLGLPLSRRLAGLLGGEVELSSQPGVGSTFSVRLPIVLAEQTDATEARDEVARAGEQP